MTNLSLFKIFVSMIVIFLNLVTLSFTNLFNMWFMMEISSVSMVTLLMINNSKKMSIAYFVVSFISGSVLLFSISMYHMSSGKSLDIALIMCVMTALVLKMSLIPLQLWSISFSSDLSWFNMFMLLIIMKIIPIYFMIQFVDNYDMIGAMLCLNIFLPGFFALNYMSLKKIMVYSSINQAALMMYLMTMSNNLFFTYFCLYLMGSILLYTYMNSMNLTNKYMFINMTMTKMNKLIYYILVVIYSNLPPMVAFIMKWSLMENLVNFDPNNMLDMAMIMISSLMMTWNYLNLINMNLYLTNSMMNFSLYVPYDNSKVLVKPIFFMVSLFMLFSFFIY